MFLVFCWHYQNTCYPRADGASFYENAQDIYLSFKQKGVLEGIKTAYLQRGGRPVIFPVIAAPFIVLNKGDILRSVAATMLFIFFIFLTYSYCFAREFVSPLRAVVCAIFLGTLSWVVKFTCIFWSELGLVVCALASLYHLKKCNYFSVRSHTIFAGIWMGMGFLTRPIEYFLAITIPFVFFMCSSWRERKLRVYDLIFTILLFVLSGGLFWTIVFSSFPLRNNLKFMIMICAILLSIVIFYLYRKRLSLNLSYFYAAIICVSLVLIWWIPGIKVLYSWLQMLLNVSPKFYHLYGLMNPLQAIIAFFSNLGGFPLLMNLILFVTSILVASFYLKIEWRNPVKYFLIALAMLLPPIVMLSLTADIDFRRAFPGFAILNLVAIIFAIHPDYVWKRFRFLLVSVLVCIQVFVFSVQTFNILPKGYVAAIPLLKYTILPSYRLGYEFPSQHGLGYELPVREGDISDCILENLRDIQSKKLKVAAYGFIDTSILAVLSKKAGSSLHFDYPSYFFSLEEGYKQLSDFNYVILDVTQLQKYSPCSVETDPYVALSQDILKRWADEKLGEKGMSLVSQFFAFHPLDKSIHKILIIKNG